MAYEKLKNSIKQAIKQNGNQEITGDIMQTTLLNVVERLGLDKYAFMGEAKPDTIPADNTDEQILYLALESGIYKNFDGIYIYKGLTLLYRASDGKWHNISVFHEAYPADEKNGLVTKTYVDSKFVAAGESLDENADLEIADSENNVLVRFIDGHIVTKNFNSKFVAAGEYAFFNLEAFKDLKVAIIGDSISSYNGVTKDGYSTYYPKGDVDSPNKTWWGLLSKQLGVQIINRAWSGSQCTGPSGPGESAWAACSDQRILDIGDNGEPDIVICYIGTNDWQDSAREQGDWNYNSPIPTSGTLINFKEAYASMIYKIQSKYKNARIFCCTLIEDSARDKNPGWPSNNNNGVSLCAFNDSIRYVALSLGVDIIELHSCGLSYSNIHNFAVDTGLHPNAEGHKMMARRIISNLILKY